MSKGGYGSGGLGGLSGKKDDEQERKAFYQLAFNNVRTVGEPVSMSFTPNKDLPLGTLVWISPAIFDLEYLHARDGRRFEVKGNPLVHLDDTFPALNCLEIFKEDCATFTSSIIPKSLLKDCLENGGKISRENAVASFSFTKGRSMLQESFSERVREMFFGKTELPSAKWASCNFSLSTDWYRVLDLKSGNGEESVYATGPQGQPVIQEIGLATMEAKRLFTNPSFCSPFLTKDPRSGQVYSLEMEWHKFTIARYTINEDGQVFSKFAARPNYLTKMGLTEDYLVVVLCPLRMTRMPEERNHIVVGTVECFRYEPDERTLFYVFSRHTRDLVCVYQHSACFTPHGIINCYHNNNSLTCDLIVYEDVNGWKRFQQVEHLRERAMNEHMPMGVLKRYVLNDLRVEAARFEGAAGLLESFPWAVAHSLATNVDNVCFNWDLLAGLPVQYYYAQSVRREDKGKAGVWWNSLVKIDVNSGYVKTLYTRNGSYPGPPIFITQPDVSQAEEEAVVVASFPPTPESMRTVYTTTSSRQADSLALEIAMQLYSQRYRQELDGVIATVSLDSLSLTSSVVFASPKDGEELGRIELPEITSPMKSNGQVVWLPNALTSKRLASITQRRSGAEIEISTPTKQQLQHQQQHQLSFATPKKE